MTCMKNHRQIINSGFSLIEAVVVIAITGVIIAIVGKVLLSAPVTGYVDTARRAEMVDIADTALRRMGRDLHNALPNSVRVTNVGSVYFLEYLDVRTGGRYRAGPHTNVISSISVANPTVITTAAPHGMSSGTQVLCSGTNSTPIADGTWSITVTGGNTFTIPLSVTSSGSSGTCVGATSPACPNDDSRVTDDDNLSFDSSGTITDTCFKTLGNIPNRSQIVNTDYLVVFNLGIPGASAYESPNTNKSLISSTSTSGSEDKINFAAQSFKLSSPGNRFDIATGPVSYVCDPTAKTLRRYSGYAIQAAQPTNFDPGHTICSGTPPANSSLLACNISACTFTYNAAVVAQRDGLVSMSLSVTEVNSQGQNETVSLYEAAHVSNLP